MPGATVCRGSLTKLAVGANLVKASTVDKRVSKVLEFVDRARRIPVSKTETERNLPQDRDLNRRLAQNDIVLLKNDESILPIPKTGLRKVALIGSQIKDSSVNSSGATALEPYYTIHPYEAIKCKLEPGTKCAYEVGAYLHKMMPLLDERLANKMQLRLFNEASWAAAEELPWHRTTCILRIRLHQRAPGLLKNQSSGRQGYQ